MGDPADPDQQPPVGGYGQPPHPADPADPDQQAGAGGRPPAEQPSPEAAGLPPPPALPVADEPEGLLESAVGVLNAPTSTLRSLVQHPRISWAVGLTVGLAIISGLAGAASVQAAPPDPLTSVLADLGAGVYVAAVVVAPIVGLAGLALITAIVLGSARLFGGRPDYAPLFCGLAFTNVPTVLAVPFQLLPLVAGPAGAVLSGVVGFGLRIWSLVLAVLTVREAAGLSTGKAVGAVLLPAVVLFLAFIILGVIAAAILTSM